MIYKNRDNELVVKESNLPTLVAYKYKECNKASTNFIEVTSFSDVSDANMLSQSTMPT